MEKNGSITEEVDEEEYVKLLEMFAKMIVNQPELIDEIREAILFSAINIVSSSAEVINEFRRLALEIDSFLLSCQIGELDPKTFIS